jgi:hypothetical protein
VFLVDSGGDKIEAVPDVIVEGPRTEEHAEHGFRQWLERNESWATDIPGTTRTLIDLGKTGDKRFQSPDLDDNVFLVENPPKRDYRVRVNER